MAPQTGNNYISGILTNSVEIPTPISVFSMMTSSIKDSPNNCNNDRIPKIVRLAPKMSILPIPVVDHCRNHLATLYSGSPWSKISDLPLEFRRYSWTEADGDNSFMVWPSLGARTAEGKARQCIPTRSTWLMLMMRTQQQNTERSRFSLCRLLI